MSVVLLTIGKETTNTPYTVGVQQGDDMLPCSSCKRYQKNGTGTEQTLIADPVPIPYTDTSSKTTHGRLQAQKTS